MKRSTASHIRNLAALLLGASATALAFAASPPHDPAEVAARAQIAAASLADAVIVDCQLPGRLQQLGGMRTYLTPGVLARMPAIDCRTRGGEYTIGDLASGTLSLQRWLPLAEKDNVEAQYYVARIYANGMDGVPVDYARAAQWYQRAAQRKYAPAMQELGYLYEQGLGVPQDGLMGLNLQRQASGLGEDLDYASRMAADRAEYEHRIAELTDQLDAANAGLESSRSRLDQLNDELVQGNARIASDQNRLRELRGELEAARRAAPDQNAARVRQLEERLAASEAELSRRQDDAGQAAAYLTVQRARLADQLSRTQQVNSELNQMLESTKSENEALRTRLAQSEQRLGQSQQELSTLRADYLRDASALAARSAELQQLRSKGTDAAVAAGLLESRQREIEQQQQQIRQLEGQLATAKQQSAAERAADTTSAARTRDLEQALAVLKTQNAQQQQDLQAQRAAFARLQSQSREDASGQAGVVGSLNAQLAQRAAELQDRQQRISTLQQQVAQLQEAYNRERGSSQQAAAAANDEAQRERDALRTAQDTIAKQRESLEQLQMQSAALQLQLVQARAQSSGAGAAQQRIAALETDLAGKDRQIEQLRGQLTSTSARPGPAADVSFRMPQAAGSADRAPQTLINMVRGLGPANYHALIIANGNYRSMEKLRTPISDAQDIRRVLEGRYGFSVKMLTDATRDQIMAALNEYARTMNDSDRLLIYFAGHGSTRDYPPERAFWAAVDTDPKVITSWLSAQIISDAISAINAHHVLLVADSCFSSVITHATSTIVARSNDEHSVQIRWTRKARMVLTSGQDQPVVDSSSADTTHSLFADQFLAVLRQNNILLSGEMLAHEISARMTDASRRLGVKQTPTYSNLQDPQHNFGDFFFVPVAETAQVAALTR